MSDHSTSCCPRCEVNLLRGRYQGVPIELCPQCHGLTVRQDLLVTLLQAVVEDLDEPIDTDAQLEPVPDKGANNRCPQCGTIMENYGYMETKFVVIDACPKCVVLWIDAEELGPMSWLHARSQRRSDDITARSRAFREQTARRTSMIIQSRAMANRVAAGLL